MKTPVTLLLSSLLLFVTFVCSAENHNLFFYSPASTEGLHAAYFNGNEWKELGQVFSSDYSTWGPEKKMYDPYVIRMSDGTWRAAFSVNATAPCIAVAYGFNAFEWRPQDYPVVSTVGNSGISMAENTDGTVDIYFQSSKGQRKIVSDKEFRHFGNDIPEVHAVSHDSIEIDGKIYRGNAFCVSEDELDEIVGYFKERDLDEARSEERMSKDAERFGALSDVHAVLKVSPDDTKAISDELIGVFFEDLSHAADGGLYAELVQNRDFEYNAADQSDWHSASCWDSPSEIVILTEAPLSVNNPHFARLNPRQSLVNEGFDGIPARWGNYDFSLFARSPKACKLTIELIDSEGIAVASAIVKVKGKGWKKYSAALSAPASERLYTLRLTGTKAVDVDMVSLFPAETFKGHGLRKDLAETIAAMEPKFVRFPGGCLVHGQGLGNMYRWEDTIGPLEDRKPDKNIWHYHQTRGLGFYEYFQFCEDIGAEPLPVLPAGVPCQNSAPDANGLGGQQGGVPMEDMPAFCQEFLHLVEWANGDPATSEWARKRAEAGHPEPFNLKYIGIGNEDLISTVFEERYLMIAKTLHEKYPEIKIIGTVGPFHRPSPDYLEGWKLTDANKDLFFAVDEHYYESTGWFLNHQDYYDGYDRNSSKVFLGEYASRSRTFESALAEAIYLLNCERNGDVVWLTSYAPLLCNNLYHNWDPDLIYFDHNGVHPTPSYETQRLFSVHDGDVYIQSSIDIAPEFKKRVCASVVFDSKTGERWLKVVNALPAEVDLDLQGISIPAGAAMETVSSLPSAREVQPVKGHIASAAGSLNLKPYSITVVQL